MNDERGLGQADATQKDGAGFVQHAANEADPDERANIVFSLLSKSPTRQRGKARLQCAGSIFRNR